MQIYFKFETFEFKRVRILLIIIGIIFLHFISTAQNSGNRGKKITTIVLDAGHGGKDPGALGKHSREKDIALKTVLKIGKYLEENIPDVKVIYTRKKDVFVELKKRGEIANKNNADLFISVHCNSSTSPKFYGAETYVLGSDENRSKRNMRVAMLENAAILLEKDSRDNYNGFDPNSPESYIIFSLKQNDYKQKQSLILAQKVQNQFKNRVGRRDRGVYQAGFLVLAGTYMPSILVELGYLSNPTEEKFLLSDKGQTYLASAIYRAIKEYKREYEQENNKEIKQTPRPKKEKTATKIKSTKTTNISGVNYRVQFYTSPKKIPVNDRRFSKVPQVSFYYHNGLYKYTSGHFSNINDAVKHQKVLKSLGYKDAFVVKMKDGKRYTGESSKRIVENNFQDNLTEYRIQFYTSPKKIPLNDKRFYGLPGLTYYYHNGLYKYTSGHFESTQKAKSLLHKIKSKGFKDAFIVKFNGGKRVQ